MSVLPIHVPVLLLVVASVTYAYNHCRPPAEEEHYNQFLRQHYDDPKTSGNDYCDKMMHLKCMTNRNPPQTRCKETNSFIHATKKQIQAVCGNAGTPYGDRGDLRVSLQPFRVTTCKNHGNASVLPCEYRGSETTRKIVIACEGGLPTHFEEGIVVPH